MLPYPRPAVADAKLVLFVSAFSPATLHQIEAIVGASHVLQGAEAGEYAGDWTRVYPSRPGAVAKPGSVEEVCALVALAVREGLPLVPSGGRTGLSGGAVASAGERVVALDRLDAISEFDPIDRSVRCGAGVTTARLQEFASEQGLFYPVDFASSGSSQLGGNVATNAGGIKVIRYGMTRQWIRGLKVVTGSGELLDLNRGLIKNNAGYDLRHLFIGSEGTLGIVVEVTVGLARPPVDPLVMVLGVRDMQAAMELLQRFQGILDLSAFEFFSDRALDKVATHAGVPRPFSGAAPYFVLAEFEQASGEEQEQAMNLFETMADEGVVLDGVLSQSLAQASSLWRLREEISATIARWTPYKNDLSVRLSRVPAFLARVEELVTRAYPEFEIIWYGHIGDGNVHLNILKPDALSVAEFQGRCNAVNEALYGIVRAFEGSVSAEHGVGLLKKDYLPWSVSAVELDLMRQLTGVFDPHGILNPGKILDS